MLYLIEHAEVERVVLSAPPECSQSEATGVRVLLTSPQLNRRLLCSDDQRRAEFLQELELCASTSSSSGSSATESIEGLVISPSVGGEIVLCAGVCNRSLLLTPRTLKPPPRRPLHLGDRISSTPSYPHDILTLYPRLR